jgi:membrane dipeptidase
MDLPRAREGGLDGAVMGLVISPREVREELPRELRLLARLERSRGIDQTLETLALLSEAARELPDELAFCRSGSEMRAAIAAGRFAALAGLEGSHGVESELSHVRAAHEAGLRMLGLTHFQASSAAFPMTVAAFDGRGLTPFGRELVSELERLRVIIDIAHVNDAGVDEVLGMATRPCVVSHAACRALHDVPRNTTDAQIRRIAEQGGLVALANGRDFVGRPGVEGYVDHIEHVIRVGGVDAPAIGTDFDGAITPVEGMPDVTSYPLVTQELLRRGHPEAVVRKLLGENALRVICEVTG